MKKLVLFGFTIISGCFHLYGQTESNECQDVNIDFTTTIDQPTGGIQFNSAVINPNNLNLNYKWQFGNDEISSDADPFCVYEEGTYTVIFTVTGANNCKNVISKTVEFYYTE